MSDQRNLFEAFTPVEAGTWSIIGIGDNHLEVRGRGNIKIIIDIDGSRTTRNIRDVLYVPGLGTNSFSIGAATEHGLEARFQGNQQHYARHVNLESFIDVL